MTEFETSELSADERRQERVIGQAICDLTAGLPVKVGYSAQVRSLALMISHFSKTLNVADNWIDQMAVDMKREVRDTWGKVETIDAQPAPRLPS